MLFISWSKYCDREIFIPFHNKFDDELIDTIKKEQYDILIPVGTTSYKICHRLHDRLVIETDAKLLLTSNKSFETAMSKELTLSLADSIGISTPKTIIPTANTDFETVSRTLGSHVVIKARHELGINVVEYARSTDELTTKFNMLNEKHDLRRANFLLYNLLLRDLALAFFGFL